MTIRLENADMEHYRRVISAASYAVTYAKGKKLYSCNATIHEYNKYFVLKSYNTPIALFTLGTENGVLYDFLRTEYGYTSTSAQHICKFRKWLKEKGLYDDSTVNVRFTP